MKFLETNLKKKQQGIFEKKNISNKSILLLRDTNISSLKKITNFLCLVMQLIWWFYTSFFFCKNLLKGQTN